MAVQSDGKIVIAGRLLGSGNPPSSLFGFVARYNGNGAPPPPPSSFNICLQNGSLNFRFNSTTGAYEFRDCSKGVVLTGTGVLSGLGCKVYLNDTGPNKVSDRNISITVNTCTKVATVSITIKSLNRTYGFTDNDMTTGVCQCP